MQRTTPGLALVLLLLVSATASLALTRGLTAQAVPELQASDVGKPFQSASPAGLKAARDYDVLDRARTEARRAEARSSVLPVYDYNPGVLAEQRQTLHGAFAELRADLGRLEPDVRGGARTRRPGVAEASSLGLLAAREALEKRLFVLEDEDFQALVQARASRESEDATEALLQHAYLTPLVASREELGSATALAVRQLGEGVERMTSPLAPAVLDLREARAEVERLASLPGNLLPDAPAALRRAVLRLAKRLVRPDLTVNTAETEARRAAAAAAVKDAIIQVKRGQ